jgi:hypothetical protein
MDHSGNLTTRPTGDALDSIALGVLKACREVVVRQQEVLPLLAALLDVKENQVFYDWMFRRIDPDPGTIGDTGWSHHFHGFECDLRHADGRFLRIDFGPRGRLDTFTMWGILQFVMTSRPPWSEFADLKNYFAQTAPPFDELSGSHSMMCAVWDALETRGAFEPADPALVTFLEGHTATEVGGLTYIRLPEDTHDELRMDCLVAHRPVLSRIGHQLLEMHTHA